MSASSTSTSRLQARPRRPAASTQVSEKRVRFGTQSVRVTLEAFNVFNIAQRTTPGQSILTGTFGQYTAVEQPRALQLTLQYDF